MTFFGMGPLEIMVILVVALLVFGPDKLPQVARQVGELVRNFRRVTADLTAEFHAVTQEFSSEFDELRSVTEELQAELRGMQADLRGVQTDLQRELGDVNETLRLEAGGVGVETTAETAGAPAAAQTIATAGYGAATMMETSVASNGHSRPVASKSDPVADVSFLDLEELAVMPRSARPTNGHQPPVETPPSPAPERRPRTERRVENGYRRPRLR